MPTYSYACTACDHKFDAVQAFTDDALTTCPECSGRLRKLFNSVGVVFKGSGFYRTDSRESGKPASGSSGESGTAASGSKSSGSGESGAKSDSKSDTKSGSSGSKSSSPSPSSTSSGSSSPAAASSG